MTRPIHLAGPLLIAGLALGGCAAKPVPEIRYDATVPPLEVAPALPEAVGPAPLHRPPSWTPSRGGAASEAPIAQVANANAAARIEPRKDGYYNAIQIYPWSEGALYQVYTAPGQITDIALEPGERLAGAGPIAAGDTARWIIGDAETGSGAEARVHVLVKPTRSDLATNLVIGTDRRSYLIELRAGEGPHMPAVAWAYPPRPKLVFPASLRPRLPAGADRHYRYGLAGDDPPWRPASVFDDGRKTYIVFPAGIVQGEMPPLFVLGPRGAAQIVNSRLYRNVLIVDRLFAAAELRLGSGKGEQVVRILRINAEPRDRGATAGKPE